MRNHPSNQSRDYRFAQQSSHSGGSRHVTGQESHSRESGSRASRRMDSNIGSRYEYVPSPKSSQRKHLTRDTSYEKPSLPYYVVPVLYVPQKVLSSEEIRQSSGLHNKDTMSFLLKKQQKKSSEKTMIDVDTIPCISCETKKKIKRQITNDGTGSEVLTNDVSLDQSCTGYINTSYAQSSTSLIDDISLQDDTPNYEVRKLGSPVYVQYEGKLHRKTQSRKKINPQAYQSYYERQQKTPLNKVETNHHPKANLHFRWNPKYNYYESMETTPTSIDHISSTNDGYDVSTEKVFMRRRRGYGVPTNDVQNINMYKPSDDGRCYRPSQCTNTDGYEEFNYENAEENYSMNPGQWDYNGRIGHEGSFEIISRDEAKNLEKTSTLSATVPKSIGELTSLIGSQYICELRSDEEPSSHGQPQDLHPKGNSTDAYTMEPTRNSFEKAPAYNKTTKNTRPQQSQTTFDDVIMYSTYIASDVPIRDSKSTQTVDPSTRTATTSTQTNRAVRTFATCPPIYMNGLREDVGIMAKPKTREASPSPTRYKRSPSPVKLSQIPPGDAKRLTIMKTAEMLQKPISNQSASPLSAKLVKGKRRKPRP